MNLSRKYIRITHIFVVIAIVVILWMIVDYIKRGYVTLYNLNLQQSKIVQSKIDKCCSTRPPQLCLNGQKVSSPDNLVLGPLVINLTGFGSEATDNYTSLYIPSPLPAGRKIKIGSNIYSVVYSYSVANRWFAVIQGKVLGPIHEFEII